MPRRRRKPTRYRTRKRSAIPALVIVLLLLTAAGAAIAFFNTPQRRLERALSAGRGHLSEGDYTQAVSDYTKVLDIDPANADAVAGLMDAQGALGNAQGVYDTYTQMRVDPAVTDTELLRMSASSKLYAIGESFFAGGDYDQARSVVTLLREVDEDRAYTLTDKIVEATAPSVGSLLTVGNTDFRVLERQGTSVLLYAEKAVDLRPFTETQIGVSWSYSTLRTWLNKEWIGTFDAEEASRILSHTIDNPAYPNDPESRAHSASEDRVFLLSVPELLQYFPSESDRATGYAYWTRTGTGRSDTKGVYVSENGAFATCDVRDTAHNVRPAFWYQLN